MRFKQFKILIATVLLAIPVIFFAVQDRKEENIFFVAKTEQGREILRLWQPSNEEYVVFLPSYASLANLEIQTNREIWFDDISVTYGMSCEDLELNKVYILSIDRKKAGTITFLQSQNIPALHIDTDSGSMNFIHEARENEEFGKMRLYTEDGRLNYEGRLDSIKARGNSSFEWLKKPYSLKLSSSANLLDMGEAKKWVLLSDQTNLKNKIAYDFADAIGLPYPPESRWVDLYLNGNYAGLYLLCERNEVHPQRVKLARNKGFLVSKEQLSSLESKERPYFTTDSGATMRIHFNSMRESEMIQIFQSVENAILAEDGIDPLTGKHWSQLIDLDSWVKKYLVEEIFYGIDSGVASQFFFYEQIGTAGKIYAGPVWDYDDTLHSVWVGGDGFIQDTNILYAHRARGCTWFHELYYNEVFYSRIKETYASNVQYVLTHFIEEKIPQYTSIVQKASEMNQVRWSGQTVLDEANEIKLQLKERMEFLSNLWILDREFIEVSVDFGCDYAVFNYVIEPGTYLPEIPTVGSDIWYIAGTNIPFDSTQKIYENMSIELRENQTNKNG